MSVNHHLMWARLCIFNPPPHSCRPLPVSTFGCREQEGPKPTTVSAQKGTTYILQSMCLTIQNRRSCYYIHNYINILHNAHEYT